MAQSYVFTDVVNSVALWERDSGRMSEAMARHDALVEGVVAEAGGTLVRTKGEGDSTFSVFAAALDAVLAAAAVQRAVAVEPWPSTTPIRVRIGVHTGEAEARAGDWYGPAVNRAARLRGLASGGQTLVSGLAAGLVADRLPADLRLVYRGRRILRGIERPEEVWELGSAGDDRLGGPAAAAPGGGPVPRPLTRFVGRAEALASLAARVEAERLVTVTGPGGSGKTRLVAELATELAGRGIPLWYAELAPLRGPEPLAVAVAEALGIEPGPDAVAEMLHRAEIVDGVLVLDNCEHILAACARLARQLLAAGPALRIVATSREALGLSGEWVWPVCPLSRPESADLLLDRARALRPDLGVGGAAAAIDRICEALDGLPLAIELAAGRLRSLTLVALADRLDDQMRLLARRPPAGDGDDRHRSLRVAMDWSYDLLSDEQQALARRLSVFAGGFRLEAAAATCADGGDVLDAVDEMVAKSFVSFDGATARYRLLEPVRQYLAERLAEAGGIDKARRRHASWVAEMADTFGRPLYDDQRANSGRVREEAANVDVALEWAVDHDPDLAVRIVGALGYYWSIYDQATGWRWCGPVLAAGPGTPSCQRADTLVVAAEVAHNEGESSTAVAWLDEALAIYRNDGHTLGEATCAFTRGRVVSRRPDQPRGPCDEAAACYAEAARLFKELGNTLGWGWSRALMGFEAFLRSDLDVADTVAVEVAEECEAAGVRHPVGHALQLRSYVAVRRGEDAAALAFLARAGAVYRDLEDPNRLAGVLLDLASAQARLSRADDALDSLAEVAALIEHARQQSERRQIFAVAAVVHDQHGDPERVLAAVAAYDAQPGSRARRTGGESTSAPGWIGPEFDAARSTLDPDALAAATATASGRTVQQLVDEVILAPARALADPGQSPR